MINYLTRKNKAGGYPRLSKEDIKNGNNNDSESIGNQKKIIQNYAEKHGIELYDFYTDDGFSGGNFDRPGFKRLIADIEKGIIDTVIVKDTSRLGREFIETSNYIFNYFPEHNIRFISILDNYDSFNPNGMEDVLPYQAVSNFVFLKETSKKIKSVRHAMMLDGKFVGSSVSYGYKRSEKDNLKFEIDEYAANVVKRIFQMKYDGITNPMIARTLTNEGVLPPDVYKGKKNKKSFTTNIWKASSIGTILKNEVYIGTLIQGKFAKPTLKSKKKFLLPRDQWIIVENNHEPIIDKDLFYTINSNTQNNGVTRTKKYNYLLKGLVVCADCGKTMIVRRVKRKNKTKSNVEEAIYCCKTYATYRNNICSMHYFKESILNEIVLNQVRNILKSYIKKQKLEEKYAQKSQYKSKVISLESEMKSLKNNINVMDKAISDLYIDRANGLITQEDFYKIKSSLESEKKENLNKISKIELNIGKSKMNNDENFKNKVIEQFLKMKNPSQMIIRQLIKKIEIDEKKNVKIYFSFYLDNEVIHE